MRAEDEMLCSSDGLVCTVMMPLHSHQQGVTEALGAAMRCQTMLLAYHTE